MRWTDQWLVLTASKKLLHVPICIRGHRVSHGIEDAKDASARYGIASEELAKPPILKRPRNCKEELLPYIDNETGAEILKKHSYS
jgi:hypothetical protein